MKKALITGITGQDGAYLAQFLLEKSYQVYGTIRQISTPNLWRLEALGIKNNVELIPMDLLEYSNIERTLEQIQPNEIYNLAAQSFVATSFQQPLYTTDVDAMGVTRLLQAIQTINPKIKFFQASTAEMFGQVQHAPQSESTPFHPRNPYGTAKLYAHWLTSNFRESLGIHASSGILFNHESPLRGEEFVTRKITQSLARIKYGLQTKLELGNLEAQRDWGYAKDYVVAMWQMLQQPNPDNYVLATGQTHSVKEFVTLAARSLDIEINWQGQAQETIGIDTKTGKTVISVNSQFYRPTEHTLLVGDTNKAKTILGWQATTTFEQLVTLMTQADAQTIIDLNQ
jgi:GDPmannose 4,6-dehydratase